MRSMLCPACNTRAVPKTYTPSSLPVELTVWVASILVGLVAGLRSALFSSSVAPTAEVQSLMLSSLTTSSVAEASADSVTTTAYNSSNLVLEIASWFSDVSFEFVTGFWWALVVPVLFSLWRQSAKYKGCRGCGSRELVPIEPTP